jgi:predicted nucleic acid-binding protein
MNYFYLDASAHVKRYHPEDGSDIVNLLFEQSLLSSLSANKQERLISSRLGILEIMATLNRKKNDKLIPEDKFRAIVEVFWKEMESFLLYPLDDKIIADSLYLIFKYNLNASDALYLFIVLKLRTFLEQSGDDIVLVTADKRLFRAGLSEGLQTVNPEAITSSIVRSLL